jgi:hypothetical protein
MVTQAKFDLDEFRRRKKELSDLTALFIQRSQEFEDWINSHFTDAVDEEEVKSDE